MSGELPEGWRPRDLGSIINFINGYAFKPEDWRDAGTPIIRIQNLNGSDAFNYFDGSIPERYHVEAGDLLFCWSGSRGTSFGARKWTGPLGYLNQHIFRCEVSRDLDDDFAFFLLEGMTSAIEAEAHGGGGLVHIKKSEIVKFDALLPPLDEQRRIAEVLRSVDEAIAAAALVVTQATEAFEALLADLFARYGDASATLESYCLPGGLQTGPFGSQLKAEDYVEDGVPVIMPVDLTPEGMDFSGAKKAPVAKSKELVRHILHPGDVLFARRGEIGRCGLYLENDPVALCGTGCLRARLDTAKVDPALAYFLIQSRQARDWLRAHAVGATMPNLNTTIIGDLPMPDIPMDQQKGWVDALLMIEGTKRINQRTLTSFQRSKSTLMSDLLSGRVRVPA
jgi:type I restriction enzyme S subunit